MAKNLDQINEYEKMHRISEKMSSLKTRATRNSLKKENSVKTADVVNMLSSVHNISAKNEEFKDLAEKIA